MTDIMAARPLSITVVRYQRPNLSRHWGNREHIATSRQFPSNELLPQGSGRYNAPMPWSHRVLPLPAFASRRNRPLPEKAALIAGYRLPKSPHYGSDETCSPTGKPSKSCLLPPSDKPAVHPGSSVASERLDWSQQVLPQLSQFEAKTRVSP